MPIKLITSGGGSAILTPTTNATDYTLTVPAVTANVVTTGDSNSVTAGMIAPNVAGRILSSTGSATAWVNGWTLINTITGTSTAALEDTTSLTSTYANYMIFIRNLVSSTNSVTLLLRFYTGGSYQTTGYLGNCYLTSGVAFSATTGVFLTNTNGNNSSYNMTGALYFSNPSSSTLYKMVTGTTTYYDNTGTAGLKGVTVASAFTTNTNAITGFQILASSGNITGTVQVYGSN